MIDKKKTSIIVEHDFFRETYSPDRIKARESQSEQILCCLSPIIKRQKPIHVWLYGKPGTGKTLTAIHALRLMEERGSVKSVIINCWEKRTFYEILDEMISQLRLLGADEHRTSFKLEKLRYYLNDYPFIAVLDEIDQIKRKHLSTVLYNLDSMLNAVLICISGTIRPLQELEERVRSRINPHMIFFPQYSHKNLLEILTARSRSALAPGSWTQKTLERIATAARGDGRSAIRMLHKAAVLADHKQMDRIPSRIIEEQIKAVRDARVSRILDNLTEDHRILFKIVESERRILSGNLWQKYLQSCKRLKRKPLSSRTYSDHANRLVQAGLITSERARVKGKVRLFKYAG